MADFLKPDLCVVGAGALGTALAIIARQRGLDVVLVRQPRDAANDPTAANLRRAAFVASAERAEAVRTAGRLGLGNTDPKPNFRTIGERASAIAETIAPSCADDRLTALGIAVLAGDTAFADRNTLRCGEASIRARQFVLTTGSQPLMPALPGLDKVAYFTPDTIADNMRKLSHLVVIGGTPEALELAQAYRRLGSTVTLVPQGGLLPGFDRELVAILLRDLREEGLAILDDAEVTAIQPRNQGTGIALRRGGDEDRLDVSHILVAMGRLPDLDTGLLEAARLRRDPIRADHLLLRADGQTSNGRISAIGGAADADEAHIGHSQAGLVVERLLGQGSGRLKPQSVPRLVQTQPALAQIGVLESDQALRPGQIVLRSNLAENQAGRAQGLDHGVAKLVTDQKGTIDGAGMVGAGASEIMTMLALASGRGLSLGDLAHLALPQPSVARVLLDLAAQFEVQRPSGGWARRLPFALRW